LKKSEQEAFKATLAQIVSDGVSTAENEAILGVSDIAVPVGKRSLGISAALACSSLISGKRRQGNASTLAALQKAAAEIGQRLGLVPE
jgi:DNA-binding IclR family transcriptional regulator